MMTQLRSDEFALWKQKKQKKRMQRGECAVKKTIVKLTRQVGDEQMMVSARRKGKKRTKEQIQNDEHDTRAVEAQMKRRTWCVRMRMSERREQRS